MSSRKTKDRVSSCTFTFSDGRRCRAPRFDHPRFCPDHARKEASARAREDLAKDLAYFFSGDYLSACDLTVALGRLIPAVIRGDVKGKAARTVAYLAQTLLQSIHVSQNEYTNTFGSDAWRTSIRNSINENHDYRFPSAPQSNPAPAPEPPPVVAGLQTGAVHAPQTATTPTFDQGAVANLQTGAVQPPPTQASPVQPHNAPAEPSPNCHSERSRPTSSAVFAPAKTSACAVEESAFSSPSVPPPAEPHVGCDTACPGSAGERSRLPSSPSCHPACPGPAGERSEGSQPVLASQHSPEAHFDHNERPSPIANSFRINTYTPPRKCSF